MFSAILAFTFFNPLPLGLTQSVNYAQMRGTVREVSAGHHGRPIANATVFAVSDTDTVTVTSDADGRFFFMSLLPGNYHIYAAKTGFVSECMTATRDGWAEIAPGLEYGADIELGKDCR